MQPPKSAGIDPSPDASDWPEALYRPQEIERYRGNPFIEALPPILDEDAAVDAMQRLVTVSPRQRALPVHLRRHELPAIEEFHQPLDTHVELFDQLSVMIRAGYVKRNPLNRSFIRDMEMRLATLKRLADAGLDLAPRVSQQGAGSSLAILGMSGVGKSHAVDGVLRTYDQVIVHSQLSGPIRSVMQIVHLKVTCPDSGSIRGLCIEFILAVDRILGTSYFRQYVNRAATVDNLRAVMARISFLHGLGLLVIDEVQHLNSAKSGGAERMINFFKLLSDVMGVPVLVVGTQDAEALLGGNFQTARRHSGMPMFQPTRLYAALSAADSAAAIDVKTSEPRAPSADEAQRHGTEGQPRLSEIDEVFHFFCESLFRAQFLAEPIELDRSLLELLHWLTQGITGVLVKLFTLTQHRALSMRLERLSPELFQSTYNDCFGLLHPHLNRLRAGLQPNSLAFSNDLETFGKNMDRNREAATRPSTTPTVNAKAPPHGMETDRTSQMASASDAKPKPRSGRKALKSSCLLVRLVEEGVADGLSPHQALFRAGLVRKLGTEAATA